MGFWFDTTDAQWGQCRRRELDGNVRHLIQDGAPRVGVELQEEEYFGDCLLFPGGRKEDRQLGFDARKQSPPEVYRGTLLNARAVIVGDDRRLSAPLEGCSGIVLLIDVTKLKFGGAKLHADLRWNSGAEGVRSNRKILRPFFSSRPVRSVIQRQIFMMNSGDELYVTDLQGVTFVYRLNGSGFEERPATPYDLSEQVIRHVRACRGKGRNVDRALAWGERTLRDLGMSGKIERMSR